MAIVTFAEKVRRREVRQRRKANMKKNIRLSSSQKGSRYSLVIQTVGWTMNRAECSRIERLVKAHLKSTFGYTRNAVKES
jgi:hypothetical protein